MVYCRQKDDLSPEKRRWIALKGVIQSKATSAEYTKLHLYVSKIAISLSLKQTEKHSAIFHKSYSLSYPVTPTLLQITGNHTPTSLQNHYLYTEKQTLKLL
jgi:hypothetical protein